MFFSFFFRLMGIIKIEDSNNLNDSNGLKNVVEL